MVWREPFRRLIKLSLPLIAAMWALQGTEVVDAVMLGHLGQVPLAAGGLAFILNALIMMPCVGIVSGVGVSLSQALGADELEKIPVIAQQGLWLGGMLALIGVIIYLIAPQIFTWIGEPPDVVIASQAYLYRLVWAVPFMMLYNVLREVIMAFKKPKILMVSTFLAMPINALLDYLLIYGFWKVPAMGIAGAAWASVIVLVGLGLFLWVYVQHMDTGSPKKSIFSDMTKPQWSIIRNLLRIGLPVGVHFAMDMLLFASASALMGLFGVTALAGHQVAIEVEATLFMTFVGISQATTVLVGYAVGANDPIELKRVVSVSVLFAILVSGLNALCFTVFAKSMTAIFVDVALADNAEVVSAALNFMMVAACFQLGDGLMSICSAGLRGMKDTFAPMLLTTLGFWGVGFPVAFLMAFHFNHGPIALWWGLGLGICSAGLFLSVRFYHKVKSTIRSMRVMEKTAMETFV